MILFRTTIVDKVTDINIENSVVVLHSLLKCSEQLHSRNAEQIFFVCEGNPRMILRVDATMMTVCNNASPPSFSVNRGETEDFFC